MRSKLLATLTISQAAELDRISVSGRITPDPEVRRPTVSRARPVSVSRTRYQHRPVAYLNKIMEQDRRAIKKRICAKQHFRRFDCARRTIQGYETIHKIRKGQVRWLRKPDFGPRTR
jgi:hypothetical protein